MYFLHTGHVNCYMHVWLSCSLSLSVFYQPSLWVVTVQVLHLVGLFLQSLLREQLAGRHLSEKHYTYWCFNPPIFHPSSYFSHLQPLNLLSILCPFFPPTFCADAKTGHSCSIEAREGPALSDILFIATEDFEIKHVPFITFCHSINSSCTTWAESIKEFQSQRNGWIDSNLRCWVMQWDKPNWWRRIGLILSRLFDLETIHVLRFPKWAGSVWD